MDLSPNFFSIPMNVIGVLPCVCIKINILQLQWNTLSILFNISGFYIIIMYLVFALDNGVVVMGILMYVQFSKCTYYNIKHRSIRR